MLNFFKKYYKSDITEDELKDIVNLKLICKNIEFLPSGVFDKCVNLHTLDLSFNKLTAIDPNTFVNNVNLHTLDLSYNNLTAIQPDTFVNNVNLHNLSLSSNKLTTVHCDTFVNNVNLNHLDLAHNKLTEIDPNTFVNLHILDLSCNKLTTVHCDTFVNNVNLHNLYLSGNKLTVIEPNTFVNNVNLHTLSLSSNKLTTIYCDTFVNNVNLHILILSYNNLSSLPLEIINLRNLREFHYNNNPIENIHPVLMRFLNAMRNRVTATNRGIYSDTQSVHSGAIQESVRNSIIAILKDESETKSDTTREELVKDDILTPVTKSLIFEYITDSTTHSTLFITFEDLFIRVWNRIKQHPSSTELKQILNQEMKESECRCFTGRLSRLVNVLSGGFFDDVNIVIHSSDQIANVILTVKEKLEKEGIYTLEKHKVTAFKELTERGYENDVIKVWIDEII